MQFSALRQQNAAIPRADIHNDAADTHWVWGLLVCDSSNIRARKVALGNLLARSRLLILNITGSSIQPSISDQISDCFDDSLWANMLHSRATPADPVTGSIRLNGDFHIVYCASPKEHSMQFSSSELVVVVSYSC